MGWHKVARASPFQRISFKIAIKQTNLDKLESTFWDVHNPDSKNWRNFMSVKDIDAMVKPTETDFNMAKDFVHYARSARIVENSDSIDVYGISV
jgi:subtilase family serine protease